LIEKETIVEINPSMTLIYDWST